MLPATLIVLVSVKRSRWRTKEHTQPSGRCAEEKYTKHFLEGTKAVQVALLNARNEGTARKKGSAPAVPSREPPSLRSPL